MKCPVGELVNELCRTRCTVWALRTKLAVVPFSVNAAALNALDGPENIVTGPPPYPKLRGLHSES